MKRTISRMVTLTSGANTPLTGSSPRRTRIRFSVAIDIFTIGTGSAIWTLANTALKSQIDPNAVLQQYVQFHGATTSAPGTPPIAYDVDCDGDCVTGEWHCWASIAGLLITVTETIDDCAPRG